jgi:NAD(P)-dependent dehydrogenase (short-subunit alcohol dehydrogenase family)
MTAAITDNPEVMERRLREIPLRRLGRVEDVAFGALYLASDESSYITGIELIIDGGLTAQ